MRKTFFVLFLLSSFLLNAGTREEIEKLQKDLLLMQKKIDALSVELLNLNKKIEIIESKMEEIKRSSQTADLRVDLESLKIEVDKLNNAILELKETKSYITPQTVSDQEDTSQMGNISSDNSPEIVYKAAYSDYIQGRYQLAIEGFKKFIEAYPDNPLVENSYYWIGECYYGIKDYVQAKDFFEKVMDKYPKGVKYYSAKLKLALAHYNLGAKELCRKMLVEIIKDNPSSNEAGIAREKLRILFQN